MIAGATHTQERGLGEIYPGIATLERSGIKIVVMATTMIVAMTTTMTTETGIRPPFPLDYRVTHIYKRRLGLCTREGRAAAQYVQA